MTKIDIFSGFLGAGKTTLIKKLISEGYKGEKLVLIENEFGEIGVDGGFLKEAGIEINEMNSGCICCSLVGDFSEALAKVISDFHPDRILIEPSGVGKLSDVIKAVETAEGEGAEINAAVAVVDAGKCKMYMKNFGEFFNNQIEHAKTVILSRTGTIKPEKLEECVNLIREKNPTAVIITTPWENLEGAKILEAMENSPSLEDILHEMKEDLHEEHEHHHHHHGHEEHDENCTCGCHDHEHDEHEHHHHHHDEHEHHHHDHDEHDENCACGCHDHDHDEHEHHHHHHDEHEHHHHDHDEHDENCTCGCHDHEHGHHHHHHADEVFDSFGVETAKVFTKADIENALHALEDSEKYGFILRAKGIVNGGNVWIHFDYTPEEPDVREGGAEVTGRICVIGSKINKKAIAELFGI